MKGIPRLEIAYAMYVNRDLPPPRSASGDHDAGAREIGSVALNWTCRDGTEHRPSAPVLDREIYPKGYFYSMTQAFQVDESDTTPERDAGRTHRSRDTRLRLPCELTFTYEEGALDPFKQPRQRQNVFVGCVDRSGVRPGPC